MTSRKAATAGSRRPPGGVPRGRSHSLAPEHLGEVGSGAAVAVAVGGLSLVIAAGSMIVNGLTFSARYAGTSPPPDVGQLGLGQLLGGTGLLVLSIALLGTALALLGDLRFARWLTVGFSAVAALLGAAGALLLVGAAHRDNVLDAGLAVAAVVFGASAVILARSRSQAT